MLRRPYLFVLPLMMIVASGVQAGSATSLATSCAQEGLHTLQDYLNLDGASCSVGILNFSNFNFSSSGTAGNALYSPSEIAVDPVFDGSKTGFSFSHFGGGQFVVGAGLTANYMINYEYVIDPSPIGAGADLGMDPPFGDITITQAICADSHFTISNAGAPQCSVFSDFAPPPTSPQTLSVNDRNPPTSWTAHLDLNPQVINFAGIQNTINLNGGLLGAGFDKATSTNTIVTPTPEPVGLVLGLSGLLALALCRKRLPG